MKYKHHFDSINRNLKKYSRKSTFQDLAENYLESIPYLSVENRTKRSSNPLNVSLGEVNGTSITLAINRDHDYTTPNAGTFRVRSNGKAIKVTDIDFFYS